MKKIFVGIDNGVTGSIGVISPKNSYFLKIPVKKEQNYTKAKGNISRIDFPKLLEILDNIKSLSKENDFKDIMVLLERPMVNPNRFKASTSALRALESVLISLEMYSLPFAYIDSKEWQRNLLPKGVKGSPELKKASFDIGKRLFPEFTDTIKKQKDADGILIAEYCRIKYKDNER